MKNIDFLPARYRERHAARVALAQRWAIVIGISLGITPLALYQYFAHAAVVNALVLVEPDYYEAEAKTKQLEELRADLAAVKGEAALLAWLNHPWPRTQVLAHVHAPLPESVRLTSVKLASEAKGEAVAAANEPRRARRSGPREAPVEDSRPPAERDLARLFDEVSQQDVIVTLAGVTVNTTELHTYVAKLRASGLFVKSELRSLESATGQESAKAQTFEIRLVLHEGHEAIPLKKKRAEPPKDAATAATTATAPEIARRP